jgi:acetate kinase
MGMTPLEGLMMGSRAGSIDPGVLLDLLRRRRLTLSELADDLDHRSGLLGVSGGSADVRDLLVAEAQGDQSAALALELFVRRAAAGIASSATVLPVLDALVVTGGIGEHSGPVRARIVERLSVLGIRRIVERDVREDTLLSETHERPAVVRVAAREDVVVAASVRALLETA